MRRPHRELQIALHDLLSSKADEQVKVPAAMGAYIGGVKTVTVDKRKDHVYVRLRGNDSEVVEAFNDSVLRAFGIQIFVVREGLQWRVVGKNTGTAPGGGWGGDAYLPNHGNQHSFSGGTGTAGNDIVWVYKRQFMPLLVAPTSPKTMKAHVFSDYYPWGGAYHWFAEVDTPDLTSLVPAVFMTARFVTAYINGDTGNLAFVTGTSFLATGTITDPSSVVPMPDQGVGIPVGSIYLLNGMSAVTWDSLWDVRNIIGNVGGADVVDMFEWFVDGPITTGTEVDGARILPTSFKPELASVYIRTPGVSGTTIIDVEESVDGTTWTSIFATRPTLVSPSKLATAIPLTPILAAGRLLRMCIDQSAHLARGLSVALRGRTR